MNAQAYIVRQEAERTAEFLNAASVGNTFKIREVRETIFLSLFHFDYQRNLQMLLLGCPPNSADYDGRCALELASVKGHVAVVKLLLASGADPSQRDNFGLTPLAEVMDDCI